jgi:hypothetical protein
MPHLQIDDLPADVYERLERLAKDRNRPVPAEAARLLEKALDAEAPLSQAQLLEEVRKFSERQRRDPSIPDSVELLREDRER